MEARPSCREAEYGVKSAFRFRVFKRKIFNY